MTSILNIQSISKKYEEASVVNQVSLRLEGGEIYGLLGPNGCGKTTLIRMITGMLPPSAGTVKLFGSLEPSSNVAKLKIGYMPQSLAVYKGLSVWENIVFFGKLYGLSNLEIDTKGDELLKLMDIKSKRNQAVSTLSGGTLRRLMLCTCLIHSPSLIILDEPTAGVDPVLRIQFWNYFEKMATENMAIIITTHHIAEASRCNKVGFMREGRIFAESTPENLMQRYGCSNLEEAFVKATANLGEKF